MISKIIILFAVAVLAWLYFFVAPIWYREHNDRLRVERGREEVEEISTALHAYAHDHDGRFPSELPDLIRGNYITDPDIFICPTGWGYPAMGPTTEAIAEDMERPDRDSYLYFGNGLTVTSPPDSILVTDKPENHDQYSPERGGFVLHLNGEIVWVSPGGLHDAMDAAWMAMHPTSRPTTQNTTLGAPAPK